MPAGCRVGVSPSPLPCLYWVSGGSAEPGGGRGRTRARDLGHLSPHSPLSPLFTGHPDTLPLTIPSGGMLAVLLPCPVPGHTRRAAHSHVRFQAPCDAQAPPVWRRDSACKRSARLRAPLSPLGTREGCLRLGAGRWWVSPACTVPARPWWPGCVVCVTATQPSPRLRPRRWSLQRCSPQTRRPAARESRISGSGMATSWPTGNPVYLRTDRGCPHGVTASRAAGQRPCGLPRLEHSPPGPPRGPRPALPRGERSLPVACLVPSQPPVQGNDRGSAQVPDAPATRPEVARRDARARPRDSGPCSLLSPSLSASGAASHRERLPGPWLARGRSQLRSVLQFR